MKHIHQIDAGLGHKTTRIPFMGYVISVCYPWHFPNIAVFRDGEEGVVTDLFIGTEVERFIMMDHFEGEFCTGEFLYKLMRIIEAKTRKI